MKLEAYKKGLENFSYSFKYRIEHSNHIVTRKVSLVETGILGFGIRNIAQGIRNLTNDWNPESKFYWKILESSIWNPESWALESGIPLTIGIQNPSSTEKYWNPVPGIRNTAQGIRKPTNDSNPESKFYWRRIPNPVPRIRNPLRDIQNPKTALDSLTWARRTVDQCLYGYDYRIH